MTRTGKHAGWMVAFLCAALCASARGAPPLAPTVTWPPIGAVLGSNRVDVTWTGSAHDMYEVHIGAYNTPNSADGWNSGQVAVSQPATTAESGPLVPQHTYYVFIRLHNSDGWGPWSAAGRHFDVDGELVNNPYFVAGPDGGQDQHTLCYNPDRNEYLIAYTDAKTGTRSVVSYYRLDSTGSKIGSEGSVVDNLEGIGGPWVCYNNARKEYLITYEGYTSAGGLHAEIRTQRVNAVNGALIGGSNWITSEPGTMLSKVGYSTVSDAYLVVWENGGGGTTPFPVYARRLDSTAAPVGGIFRVSNDTYYYAGNPSMCYNSVNDEFLITFQVYYQTLPENGWDYHAQRVRASDGTVLGPNITISATLDSDSNGDVAYDVDMNRYLVVYDGGPPSPWGQFVTASGVLSGSRFSMSNGDFNGGMSAVSWSPVTKEYLATWASCCSAGNFGRRLNQNGVFLSEPFRTNGNVTGFGNWDPISVVNTTSGEFLICWFWQYDDVYVRRYKSYPLLPADTVAPAPVTGVTLTRYSNAIGIQWTNPAAQDFSGTMVRVKTTGYPTGPTDGALVVDQPNAPSTSDSYEHTGLSRATYYYALFAHDEVPNYAAAALAQATILPGDFDNDGDIDQTDFAHLQACFSGDAVPYTAGCRDADLSNDGDVDGGDFGLFLPCLAGAEQPPGC